MSARFPPLDCPDRTRRSSSNRKWRRRNTPVRPSVMANSYSRAFWIDTAESVTSARKSRRGSASVLIDPPHRIRIKSTRLSATIGRIKKAALMGVSAGTKKTSTSGYLVSGPGTISSWRVSMTRDSSGLDAGNRSRSLWTLMPDRIWNFPGSLAYPSNAHRSAPESRESVRVIVR